MQAKGLTIPTTFTAIDRFRPVVQGMVNSLEGFTARASTMTARSERLFRRLTPALGEVQKQFLSMAGTAAVVAGAFQLGRFSIRSVMEYETALQSLQAVTGVSDLKMQSFKKEISDVASVSRKSSIDVAKSFETVGSMMSQYLDDPKGLRQITEAGITLSKAARMELEPTLMSLTSVMNQFGIKAQGAADVVNRLTAGEIVGSIRTAEAANYLQEFGAVAKNMNVTVGESTALIEALGVQLDKTKIGVGARNILTIISAAGGLDRKARKDLRKAGVDMKFLMDNTKSLSARLHELSKISKDPIKMVSVFGRENLTAGQVIFQQLAKYDEFAAKIQTTNEAQKQAKLNSSTLSQAIERLSASWVNMLTNSNRTGEGLNRVTRIVEYITNNLDTLVDRGVSVLKWLALWKAANLTASIVSKGFSIALGIQSAVMGVSTIAMKGNTLALNTQSVAMGVMSAATNVATTSMAVLNAVIAGNPIGLAIVAIAALAAGIGVLIYQEEKLRRAYLEQIKLDSAKNINNEAIAVKKLVDHYASLGMSISKATAAAIRAEKINIGMQRAQSELKIGNLKSELKKEQGKFYLTDLFYGTIGESEAARNAGQRGVIASALLEEQKKAKALADRNLGVTQFAENEMNLGNLNTKDLKGIFNKPKEPYFSGPVKWQTDFMRPSESQQIGATITIKNDSMNEAVLETPGKSRSVMPQTTSTMTVNKK